MREFDVAPEQPEQQEQWLREKLEAADTPFYNKTVFLNLLMLHKKRSKMKEDQEQLRNLRQQETELWANASEQDIKAWADNNAEDSKQTNMSEQFYFTGLQKRLDALIKLTKSKKDNQGAYNSTLKYLESSEPHELGQDLKRAMKNDNKKGLPPQDIP